MELFTSHEISSRWGGCWGKWIEVRAPMDQKLTVFLWCLHRWADFPPAWQCVWEYSKQTPEAKAAKSENSWKKIHYLFYKVTVSGVLNDLLGTAGFGAVCSLARPSFDDLTSEGNGYLKMAHVSRLLHCMIFVSDFCAACTVSQDLTVNQVFL